MDLTKWARKNKKQLIKEVTGSITPPTDARPIAVFLAGIPGAGKTEFINRLFAHNEPIVKIDLDEIVKLFPGYKPKKYYEFRTAANIIVDECVIYCRKHKLNFALDGTFGYGKAVENIKHALKRHDVIILYVWKDPLQAWQLTKDRELITNRAIDKSGFIQSYENVPKNLKIIRKKFQESVPIIAFRKNKTNDNFQMTQSDRIIDDLLNNRYNKDELEQLIK